ncbi:MAG: hypothetical protein M4579_005729 [Chaenotheca gracillima]|nr:MAG: hypothetical protein M4579_005729 [Chaenotheca gracillima]
MRQISLPFLISLLLSRVLVCADALTIPSDALLVRGVHDGHPGPSQGGRLAYLFVAVITLGGLTACFVKRHASLGLRQWRKWNTIKVLMILIYLFATVFVISAVVMQYGFSLTTLRRCHNAIILCLVFYVGSKVTLYAFLIERAYAIRSQRLRRFKDMGWIGGMLCLICGFGTISILAFVDPVYDLSEEDGRCHIGLPIKLTLSLLTFDICMNIGTTVLFLALLRPYLHGQIIPPRIKNHLPIRIQRILPSEPGNNAPVVMNRNNDKNVLERLALKSFFASLAILVGTVTNLTVLFKLQGREQGWICFTTCTIDIVWGALVIYFITTSPEDMEIPIPRSAGSTSAMMQRPEHETEHDVSLHSPSP